MRRLLTVFLLLCPGGLAVAQTFGGYNTSPDAGIYGIFSNPATAASTHFKWDVNLVGASVNIGNTYASFTKKALIGSNNSLVLNRDYFLDTISPRFQNGWAQVELLMPSVMYSIDENQSVAFTWRVRAAGNMGPFSTPASNFFADNFPNSKYIGKTLSIGKGAATMNSWNEFGLTYARVLREGASSRLKGGLTVKYLSGMVAGYTIAANTSFTVNNEHSATIRSGQFLYGYSNNADSVGNKPHPAFYNLVRYPGVGADIGFTYEWRPDGSGGDGATYGSSGFNDDADAYKLRLGISVTDIGGINYKNSVYNTDLSLVQPNLDPHLLDKLRGESNAQYYTRVKRYFKENAVDRNNFYMELPTALHLTADYQLYNGWAVSGNAIVGLNTKSANNFRNNMITSATLTPRYEHGWWSAFLPMSGNRYRQVDVGLGFRLGPLLIGSSSILSDLVSKHIDRADAFIALRLWTFPSGSGGGKNKGALRQVQCAM